ncbi:MAG: hypothetical protein AMJ53_16080 [Gammaproteobacteria bacterium SG8_11]|nr:MAG: hypothetical protein AMJ53_16080 [Gammaproteobacteria bacterium SG8_11]
MLKQNSFNLASITLRGTAWKYTAFYIGKFIVFIATVLLARLLSTDDFGVVGYAVTAIGFLEILKELGISQALIYYQDKPNVTVTAFWLSMGISLALCTLAWVGAPLVGAFFQDARAVWVTRVLVLSFPLSALGSTHETLLLIDLAFSRKVVPDFVEAFVRGLISISLAVLGFGHWSLVIGQLGGTAAAVIAYWLLVAWRPSLHFSYSTAIDLLGYGLPMLGAEITARLALNTDYLIVGRYLGAKQLGVYTLAFRIPELVIQQFSTTVANVVFPVLTKIREDTDTLTRGFLKLTRYVSLLTVPLGLGLALLADAFVFALFTDKWVAAIPIMRAISINKTLTSLSFNAGTIYKAQGKPGILTRLSLLRLSILVPLLYWAVTGPASLIAVGWVQVGVAVVGTTVNIIVALRMLRISFTHLLVTLRPALIGGAWLTLAVLVFLHYLPDANPWIQLLGGTMVGGLVYFGALWLFQREVLLEVMQVLHTAIKGK